MSEIQLIDLKQQLQCIKERVDRRIQDVLAHGKFILGPEVAELEKNLAQFSGVKHAVTCANGTDALLLCLMALNVRAGDVIFCPSFTFAATAEVVPCLGAIPYFVDVNKGDFNLNLESLKVAISSARTEGLKARGIIAVDLFGLPADYDGIQKIADAEDLFVIADSAQAYGAKFRGKVTGALGDLATTSFFPAKPLGCYGDGGAILTDDDDLAELLVSLRFHGKGSDKYDNERIGMNSRLDTLQAAILLEKILIYEDEIKSRNRVAARYQEGINPENFLIPKVPDGRESVWAQYTLTALTPELRDAAVAKLKDGGVSTAVYYPRPLHLQAAYSQFPSSPSGLPVSEELSNTVFSIPMHPYLDSVSQERIIGLLNAI